MQKFILLRGHEGSGKSTFALEKIAEFQRDFPHALIIHIDNDHALYDENGIYHFDFAKFSETHQHNQIRQAQAFALGQREPQRAILVINANPNQKAKSCYTQIAQAQAHGFTVEIYRLHNFFANIHGVAQEDVLRGYARLNANPVDGEIHVPAVRLMSDEQREWLNHEKHFQAACGTNNKNI